MKFRIFLKSFDNNLINSASIDLKQILLKMNCSITGIVALPIKIKRFCVLRSPHIDKDSREHFEIRLYKRFFDINTSSTNILDTLLKIELPTGVSSSLKVF
jgi:small subunit ribosomal protein S10